MKNDIAPAQRRQTLAASALRTRQAIYALIVDGDPIGATAQRLVDEWRMSAGYACALMSDDAPTYSDAIYLSGYRAAKADLEYLSSIPVVRPPAEKPLSVLRQVARGMGASA